jgi:hypothetical protein
MLYRRNAEVPVNYAVQAQVIDIRNDAPKPNDSFLIDTNIWFWIAYPKGGGYVPPRTRQYANFVSKSMRARAKLHYCPLSLAELAHSIEKAERAIYNNLNRTAIDAKEFRHNYPPERAAVVREVDQAWRQVKLMASPLFATVDAAAADSALVTFQSHALDGYDLFILQAAATGKIAQVLTDDGDYCTIPGILLFTANSNVIQTASAQGKVVVR